MSNGYVIENRHAKVHTGSGLEFRGRPCAGCLWLQSTGSQDHQDQTLQNKVPGLKKIATKWKAQFCDISQRSRYKMIRLWNDHAFFCDTVTFFETHFVVSCVSPCQEIME